MNELIRHKSKMLWVGLAFAGPLRVLAENPDEPNFGSVVEQLTGMLNALIPILVSVALLVFVWGLAEYIFQAGDKSSVETGRNRMIAGVVGLFVIAAIWGLVQILASTLSLGVGP